MCISSINITELKDIHKVHENNVPFISFLRKWIIPTSTIQYKWNAIHICSFKFSNSTTPKFYTLENLMLLNWLLDKIIQSEFNSPKILWQKFCASSSEFPLSSPFYLLLNFPLTDPSGSRGEGRPFHTGNTILGRGPLGSWGDLRTLAQMSTMVCLYLHSCSDPHKYKGQVCIRSSLLAPQWSEWWRGIWEANRDAHSPKGLLQTG